MKIVVVSDDNVVYVSTNVAQALGLMLESIVSGMKPGASIRGPIEAGLRDSLGEELADTSSTRGFWISFSQDVPQISSPGIRHPLSGDETALKETLDKQVRLGNIRVVSLAEDQNLVLPESPLTPAVGELMKLEEGREIETDKIFTMITPPRIPRLSIGCSISWFREEGMDRGFSYCPIIRTRKDEHQTS